MISQACRNREAVGSSVKEKDPRSWSSPTSPASSRPPAASSSSLSSALGGARPPPRGRGCVATPE